jgi:hypothetical protein
MYTLATESNLIWKANYGNALVGFDLIYDDVNIKKMRLIEAPIDKMHDMPHNITFSKWYGVRNEIEKDMHNYKKMMIYVPNLFISGFQQIYYSSFISFGRVYFKAGPEIIKHKLDISKCCIYDDETVEYSLCKYMNKLDKCSDGDKQVALKSKMNKYLKKMNNEKLNIDSMMKCYDNVTGINNKQIEKSTVSSTTLTPATTPQPPQTTPPPQTTSQPTPQPPPQPTPPPPQPTPPPTQPIPPPTEPTPPPPSQPTPPPTPPPPQPTPQPPTQTRGSTRSPRSRRSTRSMPSTRRSRRLSSIERFADENTEHFIPTYGSCSILDKVNGYLYVIGFYALMIYIIYHSYKKKEKS